MNEAFVRSGNAAQRRAWLKLERASGKKRCGVSMRQYGEEDRAVGGELPLYDMLIPLYQHHYYLYLSLLYCYDSIGRITS